MDTTQVACQRCELTAHSLPALYKCRTCGLYVCDRCWVSYAKVRTSDRRQDRDEGLCVACDREAREYAGKVAAVANEDAREQRAKRLGDYLEAWVLDSDEVMDGEGGEGIIDPNLLHGALRYGEYPRERARGPRKGGSRGT